MQSGLLDQELRRRPALWFAEVLAVGREAGGEGLAEEDEPCAGTGRTGDQRCEMGEIGIPIAPGDVVLDRGDAHRRRLSGDDLARGKFGESLGGFVEHLGTLAEREPHQVPPLVPIRVEDLVGDRDHATSCPAVRGRTPCRRHRAVSGRMSTVTKYVPYVGYTVEAGGVEARQQPVALGLHVGGELGEERIGQAEADCDRRLERARR